MVVRQEFYSLQDLNVYELCYSTRGTATINTSLCGSLQLHTIIATSE